MKRALLVFLAINILSISFAQDKKAYQLFTKEGKAVKYDKMMKDLKETDIVLIGEMHNNPICHWLELEITKDIESDINKNTVLGAEMYESDDQIVMDEYLSGQIKKKHFVTEAKVWSNNKTDYQPLVDFAKEKELKFIATNIPRRYANIVARKGLDELNNLTNEQKKFIAPIPFEVDLTMKGYKMFLDMNMGHGSEMTPTKMAQAQGAKDATMAYFILNNWKEGQTFIHYNGTYHSDNFEGIGHYLLKMNPNLKIVTIAAVEQNAISELEDENKELANYIMAIPESMCTTY